MVLIMTELKTFKNGLGEILIAPTLEEAELCLKKARKILSNMGLETPPFKEPLREFEVTEDRRFGYHLSQGKYKPRYSLTRADLDAFED